IWGCYNTSGHVGSSTGGKSLAAIQDLFEQKHEGGRPTNSIFETGLRTRNPAERFVISSDSSYDSNANAADDEVSFAVRSLISDPPIMTTTVATMVVADILAILVPKAGKANLDTAGPSHPVGTKLFSDTFFMVQDMYVETLQQTYVPKWIVINDSALDDLDVCRSTVDHLATPVIFSQLCRMNYEQLLTEVNVGAARQTCLSSKVRWRLEYELKGRKKFEGKYTVQAGCLKEKDAEIASLKVQLSLKEAEAVEAIRLRARLPLLRLRKLLESTSLADLSNFQLSCDELSIEAASLESKKDKLADQVSALEGTCSELRDELLGPATETPKANQLQPSPKQLMLPIHRPEDQVVIRETSLSFLLDVIHARVQRIQGDDGAHRLSLFDAMVPLIEPLSAENLTGEASTFGVSVMPTTTTLSNTFIQASTIPSVSVADYEVLGTCTSTKVPSPSKILFEKEELETTPKHTTAS
nr:hypothetical protein [Tanacetum cinerariifolium]